MNKVKICKCPNCGKRGAAEMAPLGLNTIMLTLLSCGILFLPLVVWTKRRYVCRYCGVPVKV